MKKKAMFVSIMIVSLFVMNAITVNPFTIASKPVEKQQTGHIVTDVLDPAPQKSIIVYENEDGINPPTLEDKITFEEEQQDLIKPVTDDLIIHRYDPILDTSIKLELTPDLDGDWAYRGYTLPITGHLWSGIIGDDWDGETVKFLYNVTESQYLSDPLSYESDPQYYIGSDVTDSSGIFTIDLDTSTLSALPFSKVGTINILTWFDGNPSRGRGAGCPGAANVTFYGQVVLDVTYSVTNPGAGYSFR